MVGRHLGGGLAPDVLPTLQSNCRTVHVGIRVLRLNRNRLIVATRHQIQIGGERRPLGYNLNADAIDLAGAIDLTGQGPGCIAGGLAPSSCDRAGGVRRASAQIEIIAVAGAVDNELKLVLLL